jgi:prophage tail gpP-like protein
MALRTIDQPDPASLPNYPVPAPAGPAFQPSYPGADPTEVAEIYVIGAAVTGVYSDWESVWVQQRWKEAYPTFRFVATERDPIPNLWQRLPILPKDSVLIKLGGQIAITGIVVVRQTAYDANSHSVSIQGHGEQWLVWRGAILDKSQHFDGNFVSIATQVLAPFGVTPEVIGTIDPTPLPNGANNDTGETVWSFLERLGKQYNVILGNNWQGAKEGGILLIGDHTANVVDELVEGVNIKSCQCVINILDWFSEYAARAQGMRSDGGSPAGAAQLEAVVLSKIWQRYSPLLVPAEFPIQTQDLIDARAKFEANQSDGAYIQVTVTLYGWFTSRGVLWSHCVGQDVIFSSPMTTLVGETLSIMTVTQTQDRESGTQTTLELVAPWHLNDYSMSPNTSSQLNPQPNQIQQNPGTPAPTGTQVPNPPAPNGSQSFSDRSGSMFQNP